MWEAVQSMDDAGAHPLMKKSNSLNGSFPEAPRVMYPQAVDCITTHTVRYQLSPHMPTSTLPPLEVTS